WVEFDPTPATSFSLSSGWRRARLYLDAAKEFWHEWVVNYDLMHQLEVSRRVDEAGRGLVQNVDERWRKLYRSMVDRARHARSTFSHAITTGWFVITSVALALLINLRKIWQSLKRRRLSKDPASAPKLAATIWYERMTDAIEMQGWKRQASQTPSEFVRII